MARALITLCVVLASIGCGAGEPSRPIADPVVVPNLDELDYRTAQHLLAERGLRWRRCEDCPIFDSEPPANSWSTADDDHVIEQSPDPGETVERGSIVELGTSCSLEPLPEGVICID